MNERPSGTADTIRVLHVDDDPDFAELAGTFLEREDERFEIETATSASDGLDRLVNTEFDCIVSDYDMPGRNGIQFLHKIRDIDPNLPFILFTGKGSEEIASEAISAGVTDYLQKEGGTNQYTVLANRIANAVEHAQSRRMVERSEQRLRDIVDSLPHLLYVVDTDGTYLLANQTLADFHDTTVADLEGSNVADVLPDAQAEEFKERVAAVCEQGSMKHFPDVEIADPSGNVHIFNPRLLPYDFGETDGETVLGISTDVTAQRERERSLERVRERIELALEYTNSVIFEIDFGTGAVLRHGTYERFFDHRPDEVPTWQEHCENAVHPDDREAFRRFHQEFIGGHRTSNEIEYRTNPETGEPRWIEAYAHLRNDAGTDRRALGISRDITDRKERERELQRKERRYQAMFNDPNILVGLIDTDGTVLDINETAMDYIHATLDDVRGEPFWETPWFDHSETARREVQEWIDRAANGEYVAFEADRVRSDGEPYTVDGVFRPVTNDDGDVVSLLISSRDITEQRARERELERTNAVLSTLFETVPVGILAEDENREVLAANERIFDLFGMPRSPDEFVGTDCERMAHEVSEMFADSDGFIERIDELVSERIPADREKLFLRDGRVFERSHRPVELPSSEGHVWVYRDVTDREHYERTIAAIHDIAADIHRAETDRAVANVMVEAVAQLLDMPINGVALHDPSGNVLRTVAATDQAADVVGEEPIFHPGGSIAWEVFQTGETAQFDDVSTVPGRHNPETPIRSEILVPLGEHGVMMIGSTEAGMYDETDVSLVETLARHAETALDRIERERRLKRNKRRYQALAENLPNGAVLLFDTDLRYELAHGTIFERLESDPDDYVGNHISDVFDGDTLETKRRMYEATLDGGTHRREMTYNDRIYRVYTTPVRNENGTVSGGYVVTQDITDLRRREEQIQRERDRLDEFASVVSHDIRNPLSIAEGRLELVREECDSEHIEAIDRALTRMDTLIEDLLTLAREGNCVSDLEAVDLAELSEACWRNVETADATIHTHVDQTIQADPSRLAQLLENLIRNSVEHGSTSNRSKTDDSVEHGSTSNRSKTDDSVEHGSTSNRTESGDGEASKTPRTAGEAGDSVEHGSTDVTITVGELDDGFYVEDDGLGIPVDERDDVFDAGYSTSEDGTGFGLSIVKQVADAHGWNIRLTEGSDGGARFEITGLEFAD